MAQRVMLVCGRCRRLFEASQAVLQQVRVAPQAPTFCEREDCAALSRAIERQAEELAAKASRKRPKSPPKLRALEVPEKATQAAILRYLALRHVFAWRQNQGAMKMPAMHDPSTGKWRKKSYVQFAGV